MTLLDDADSVYEPGASASLNAPFESVCAVFPPGLAVTVASVTGRGGHGCPARSTGHVGPATTLPLTPLPLEYVVVGPGVTAVGAGAGAFVMEGVAEGVAVGIADALGDDDPVARCTVERLHDAKTISSASAARFTTSASRSLPIGGRSSLGSS